MATKTPFTVSELNRYIKGKLQVDPHLRNLWVGGELSNFKWHRSGHMFFTLKDAHASLRCVFFKGYNQFCAFRPEDGMEVWIRGNISVYEKEGLYQLYVEEMEPAGVGSLYLAYEQLKNRLEKEGLFQTVYKTSLPPFPRNIALITSPTGAALQDMLTTAQRRFPQINVVVVESLVQGSQAPGELVRALKYVEKHLDVDLAVLARGGGSLEELWAFNSEELARAIFHCSVPIVSAVGHETDFTIADLVADLRASTPTAAMELILPDAEELEKHLQDLLRRSGRGLLGRLEQEKQRLVYAHGRQFQELPRRRIEKEKERWADLNQRLKRALLEDLTSRGRRLSSLSEKLESLSPFSIMHRGYTYCEDAQGRLVRSAREVQPGQRLHLHFVDGRVKTQVEEINLDPEEGKGGFQGDEQRRG